METRITARKQLDRRLEYFKPIEKFARPSRGWIRAIRESIGMTTQQLASRLGVSQPRIFALEKAEATHGITLQSLNKAAEALDCTLVYALIPNSSLETYVQNRADEIASKRLATISHSMLLENQEVDSDKLEEEHRQLSANLLSGNLRRLWD